MRAPVITNLITFSISFAVQIGIAMAFFTLGGLVLAEALSLLRML